MNITSKKAVPSDWIKAVCACHASAGKRLRWAALTGVSVIGIMLLLGGCGTAKSDEAAVISDDAAVSSAEDNSEAIIELYGYQFDAKATALDLTEAYVTSPDELLSKVGEFAGLQEIDLTGCRMSNEELADLQSQIPDIEVKWNVKLCGVDVSTATKTLGVICDGVNPEHLIVDGLHCDIDRWEGIENIVFLHSLSEAVIHCQTRTFDLSLIEGMNQIETLNLWGRGIENAALLGQMTQLKNLSAACECLPKNTDFLGNLIHLEKLEIYQSTGTSLKTDHINYSTLRNMTQLQSLSIAVARQEQYLECVEAIKNLSRLTQAKFSFNPGVYIDCSLLNETAIRELSIGFLSDPKTIQSLFSLKNVTKLTVYYYSKYDDQIEALREALPDCEIICG